MTRRRASSSPRSATTVRSRVNLGVGREITIRELVELIVQLTGFVGQVRWDPTKPDGQPRRALDTSRARERFGFVARTSFEDRLMRTTDWCESVGSHRDALTPAFEPDPAPLPNLPFPGSTSEPQ